MGEKSYNKLSGEYRKKLKFMLIFKRSKSVDVDRIVYER